MDKKTFNEVSTYYTLFMNTILPNEKEEAINILRNIIRLSIIPINEIRNMSGLHSQVIRYYEKLWRRVYYRKKREAWNYVFHFVDLCKFYKISPLCFDLKNNVPRFILKPEFLNLENTENQNSYMCWAPPNFINRIPHYTTTPSDKLRGRYPIENKNISTTKLTSEKPYCAVIDTNSLKKENENNFDFLIGIKNQTSIEPKINSLENRYACTYKNEIDSIKNQKIFDIDQSNWRITKEQ